MNSARKNFLTQKFHKKPIETRPRNFLQTANRQFAKHERHVLPSPPQVGKSPDFALNLLTQNGEMCIALLHAQCLLGITPPKMSFLPLSNEEIDFAKVKSREIADKLSRYRFWQFQQQKEQQAAAAAAQTAAGQQQTGGTTSTALNPVPVAAQTQWNMGRPAAAPPQTGVSAVQARLAQSNKIDPATLAQQRQQILQRQMAQRAQMGSAGGPPGAPTTQSFGAQQPPHTAAAHHGGGAAPAQQQPSSQIPRITPEQRQKLLERISRLTPAQFQMLPPEVQEQARLYLGAQVMGGNK